MKKLKKYIRKIHLILCLASGIVVFIVAVTGCLYVFKEEIEDLTQSFRSVNAQHRAFILPSEAKSIGRSVFPDRKIHSVLYGRRDRTAEIIFYESNPEFYRGIFIDPYSGEILKIKDYRQDFFRFVLNGHFYLWMSPEIGQPVVATATLIFILLLISGLILWWPKKYNKGQRFRIQWNARWRRKNYDLHSVFGFYTLLIAMILSLTGLIWGFEWFAAFVYHTSGGKKGIIYEEPASKLPEVETEFSDDPVDRIWGRILRENQEAASIEMHYPSGPGASIYVNVKRDDPTWWRADYRYFDQYTLEEIRPHHLWGRFGEASAADKLIRMNYDIHVGAILGFPGKLMVFLASLIIASLPVTGIMLWIGRNRKKNNNEIEKENLWRDRNGPSFQHLNSHRIKKMINQK